MSAQRAVQRVVVLGVLAAGPTAIADPRPGQCNVVDVQFQPEKRADLAARKTYAPQIVVWIEDAAGNYKETLFITQETGIYGLGNRPGRADFNSAPQWPYGPRPGVFPVWAHRKTPLEFDRIRFQNSEESNLSHPYNQSSAESHYCRPLRPSEADALTCASPNRVYTDKGVRDAVQKSKYPPRQDIVKVTYDDPSVDSYNDMNPFDAVSQATPATGELTTINWPIPSTLPMGDYVMWVEVSTEFDHNSTYSVQAYPAPTLEAWGDFGEPNRGQPSVVYKVPFAINTSETIVNATTYAGYGDMDGSTGTLHPVDATITTDLVGSGEGRLGLVTDSSGNYRVRVTARPEFDPAKPGIPGALATTSLTSRRAQLAFTAPGDDASVGRAKSYEIRYRLGDEPITDANFDSSDVLVFPGAPTPMDAGTVQAFELAGLLPETTYTVAIRALDDCYNTSSVASLTFETEPREIGEVDACFIATAAYGSSLAADVTVLRHMRDSVLRKSVLGELAVEAYYTFSPPVAGLVGESEVLRWTARTLLEPTLRYVRAFRF